MTNYSTGADFNLDDRYKHSIARLSKLFDTYSKIYKLPEFMHEDKDIVPEAFEYAMARRYFIILVLYREDGSVCFQRSFDTGHLSMNLPGGSIRFEEEDTIIDSIVRVADKSFKNARIADIAPIISLKNRFYCRTGDMTEHLGLGIRALLLNDIKDVRDISRDILYKGRFLRTFPQDSITHPPARETFKVFCDWFEKKSYKTYTNEIESQHKIMGRYHFHEKTVKPAFRFLSRFLGQNSISDVKSKIATRIPKSGRTINIACGDDKSIFDLLDKVDILVANDISVDQITNMKKRYDAMFHSTEPRPIVFTNHDCLDLPFADKAFDIAICQNLLHHLNPGNDLRAVLRNLKRISKNVLIIEIQDPNEESIFGRVRHQYYMRFLKDEAKRFYKKNEFEMIITEEFPADAAKFEYFKTIRGVYMFAYIQSHAIH